MTSDILLLLVYSLRTSVSSTRFLTSLRVRATSGSIVPSTVPYAGSVPNTRLILWIGERVFSMRSCRASLDQQSGQLGQQPSSPAPSAAFPKRFSLDGNTPAALPGKWELSAVCRANFWDWKWLYSTSVRRLWKTANPRPPLACAWVDQM